MNIYQIYNSNNDLYTLDPKTTSNVPANNNNSFNNKSNVKMDKAQLKLLYGNALYNNRQ